MNAELKNAYEKTIYKVITANKTFDLRFNENCKAFDGYLKRLNVKETFIITAYNPKSELKSTKENIYKNLQLKADIRDYKYFETIHIDPSKKWSEELGFATFDLDEKSAVELAQKYEQYAIATYRLFGFLELIYLD